MLSSADVAAKWVTNTSNAGAAMKAGVMAVTVAPTHTAALHLDRYQSGVMQAVSSGKMAAALNAVSLTDWQNAMVTKGIARVPQGVQAAKGKVQTFMDQWLPRMQDLKTRIANMAKGTLADSQARAAFAIQYNAGFSKRLPGS